MTASALLPPTATVRLPGTRRGGEGPGNGRGQGGGARCYGQGTGPPARELSTGGAIYVAIASWLTPARNQIEGLGVTPDIEIVLTADDSEQGRDIAVFRAIDLLRGEQS